MMKGCSDIRLLDLRVGPRGDEGRQRVFLKDYAYTKVAEVSC